ncbi:hypothetical protein [Bradyrhizobium sp. USDA 4353]
MRLKGAFRFALYAIFGLLFVSGALWIYADQMKTRSEMDSEFWQQAAAFLLSTHGGAAMVTLLLLGALGPMHVQRAWRARKNRATGVLSLALYGLLIATAFGLYYVGSDLGSPAALDQHRPYRLRSRRSRYHLGPYRRWALERDCGAAALAHPARGCRHLGALGDAG